MSGRVLAGGKPIQDAKLIFCPVGGSPELQKTRPSGSTDANGDFKLTTFDTGDGAPAGEYKVMIRWSGPKRPDPRDDPSGRPTNPSGGDLFGGRYANPERSGLTATVAEGNNELPPFELVAPMAPRR